MQRQTLVESLARRNTGKHQLGIAERGQCTRRVVAGVTPSHWGIRGGGRGELFGRRSLADMKPACHTIAGGYGTKDAAADLTGMKPTNPTTLRRETVERTDYTRHHRIRAGGGGRGRGVGPCLAGMRYPESESMEETREIAKDAVRAINGS